MTCPVDPEIRECASILIETGVLSVYLIGTEGLLLVDGAELRVHDIHLNYNQNKRAEQCLLA